MDEYMGYPHYFNPHCAEYNPEMAWYHFIAYPEELHEWRRRYQPPAYQNYCDECMILRQHCVNRHGISGRYPHLGCSFCEHHIFSCTLHEPSPGYVVTRFDLFGRIEGLQYPDLPPIPGVNPLHALISGGDTSQDTPVVADDPPDNDNPNIANLPSSPAAQWGPNSPPPGSSPLGSRPPDSQPPASSPPGSQVVNPPAVPPQNPAQAPPAPNLPQAPPSPPLVIPPLPPPFTGELDPWVLPTVEGGLPPPEKIKPTARSRRCNTCLRRCNTKYACGADIVGDGLGCTTCSLWGLVCVVHGQVLPPRPLTGNEKESAMARCDCCRVNNRLCDRKRPCDSCIIHGEPVCRGTWFANCFWRGAPGDNQPLYYERLNLHPVLGARVATFAPQKPVAPPDYHTRYVLPPPDDNTMLYPFPGQPRISPAEAAALVDNAVLPNPPVPVPQIPHQPTLFHSIPPGVDPNLVQEYQQVWNDVTAVVSNGLQIIAVDNMRMHINEDILKGVQGAGSELLRDIRAFLHERWNYFQQKIQKRIDINLPADALGNMPVVYMLHPGNMPIERAAFHPLLRPPSPGPLHPIHTGNKDTMNLQLFEQFPVGNEARPDPENIVTIPPPHPRPQPVMANIPTVRLWVNGQLTPYMSMRCTTRMADNTFCNNPTRCCCEDTTHPHGGNPVCGACNEESLARLAHPIGQVVPDLRAMCCADCCRDIVNNPALLNQSGTRIWGFPPGYQNASSEVRPRAPPFVTRGGFMGELLPVTGCACAVKLCERTLCNAHRFQHFLNMREQSRVINEYTRAIYGTTKVCVACHKNPSIDAYEFKGAEGGENPQVPTVWQCKSCHDIVVAPPGTNLHSIPTASQQVVTQANISSPQNPGNSSQTQTQTPPQTQPQTQPQTPTRTPIRSPSFPLDPALLANSPPTGGSPMQTDQPVSPDGGGSPMQVDQSPPPRLDKGKMPATTLSPTPPPPPAQSPPGEEDSSEPFDWNYWQNTFRTPSPVQGENVQTPGQAAGDQEGNSPPLDPNLFNFQGPTPPPPPQYQQQQQQQQEQLQQQQQQQQEQLQSQGSEPNLVESPPFVEWAQQIDWNQFPADWTQFQASSAEQSGLMTGVDWSNQPSDWSQLQNNPQLAEPQANFQPFVPYQVDPDALLPNDFLARTEQGQNVSSPGWGTTGTGDVASPHEGFYPTQVAPDGTVHPFPVQDAQYGPPVPELFGELGEQPPPQDVPTPNSQWGDGLTGVDTSVPIGPNLLNQGQQPGSSSSSRRSWFNRVS
ncbi:hypothetical protein F5B19DRAFT_172323 [Rostrohypoxylon terebratum]|nr:hypothetical protein F5B19DRAFT_172323 [Rostrohypoxylon terebratum]